MFDEIDPKRLVATLTVAELRAVVRTELETHLAQQQGLPERLLTVSEVAQLLSVSERTVASIRSAAPDFPTIWITNDSPRFDRAAVLAWVKEMGEWLRVVKAEQDAKQG